MTPQLRAEKSASAMCKTDAATNDLGIRIDAVGPGSATVSYLVQSQHLNGHGICHGGYIFTLADTAFAYACNSYNKVTLAQNNAITYLSPVQNQERLTAVATEISKQGRSGIYDVVVTGGDGRTVAQFRGHSRQIRGQHFDEIKEP